MSDELDAHCLNSLFPGQSINTRAKIDPACSKMGLVDPFVSEGDGVVGAL